MGCCLVIQETHWIDFKGSLASGSQVIQLDKQRQGNKHELLRVSSAPADREQVGRVDSRQVGVEQRAE